jgi:hypothetical protein
MRSTKKTVALALPASMAKTLANYLATAFAFLSQMVIRPHSF